ncbi:cytochrome c oxidase subunit 5B2 [Alosa pseudoharengus]|uniref:cytochrome c oxidase subunit 5B2 n=1 Tax=Alosa pseudoharengus TaxID=34774 RepID=UPI003F894504
MASRILLRTCKTIQLARINAPMRLPQRALAAGKGIPTDEEQAAGLERRIMQSLKKGKDPYSIFKPKHYAGTRADPHIVPSTQNKRIVGCLCEEDNTQIVWFWVHEGKPQRCPSCGSHYQLIHHDLPH